MKGKDEWVAELEIPLQSIILKGFTTKETNPAMLFRMQCNSVVLLREALRKAYDQLVMEPKGKPPCA